MTLIAKHFKVSTSTVLRQLLKAGESLRSKYNDLPKHIGIDEFKSVKRLSGSMSFIFIDNMICKVMDIVENRQQHYLMNYFMMYSLKARRAVKTVTMDMYSPYIGVIKGCFPNAEIIIDRFHIAQHLNPVLNQIRIQTMNDLRHKRPRDYQKLKKQWRLILKNSSDLNFHNYYTHRLYDEMVSEYIMVNYLVELSPELKDTYEIVNKFKRAVRDHNFNRLKQILMDSKKGLTLEKYVLCSKP